MWRWRIGRIREWETIWRSYFSNGLKPPTRTIISMESKLVQPVVFFFRAAIPWFGFFFCLAVRGSQSVRASGVLLWGWEVWVFFGAAFCWGWLYTWKATAKKKWWLVTIVIPKKKSGGKISHKSPCEIWKSGGHRNPVEMGS